jgi:hypothetical protein
MQQVPGDLASGIVTIVLAFYLWANLSVTAVWLLCSQLGYKVWVASEVVIVIADHHGGLDTRTGGSELIENGLVRRNDVIKLCDDLIARLLLGVEARIDVLLGKWKKLLSIHLGRYIRRKPRC